MPPDNGVGSNDGKRTAGFRKQVTDPTQERSVDGRKWQSARFAPSQHDDLLSQHQHLGPQRRAGPEQIDDSLKNYPAEIQHAAEDHPILRLMPTGWNLRQGQVTRIPQGKTAAQAGIYRRRTQGRIRNAADDQKGTTRSLPDGQSGI
jgi:hypothetical protein